MDETRYFGEMNPGDALESMIQPLTCKDIRTLEIWMQRLPFQRIEGMSWMTPRQQRAAVRAATKEASGMWWISEGARKVLFGASGIAMWWYLSRKKVDSEITQDQAMNEIKSRDIDKVLGVLIKINGLASVEGEDSADPSTENQSQPPSNGESLSEPSLKLETSPLIKSET